MKNKQTLFIILVAAFAGFAGSLISNQIFQTKSVLAQQRPEYQKVVIAEEFRVVDKNGKILGSFGAPGYLSDIFPKTEPSHARIPQLRLGQESGFQIILSADPDAGSQIIVKDKKNTPRAVIGNTEVYIPLTRVTHRRPVSSIVLFNGRGGFLWSAPGGIKTEGGR